MDKRFSTILLLTLASMTLPALAAESPQGLLEHYASQAGLAPGGFSVTRGEALYRGEHLGGKGEKVSCTSCHTADPRDSGKTRVGKAIEPMAPAVNRARFTNLQKVEKWFGRNCRDVLGRACTPTEKGDFISWLASIR